MTRKDGKTHQYVAKLLRAEGIDTAGLEITTLSRGPDHLVILDGEVVGEFNHISQYLILYEETRNAPE